MMKARSLFAAGVAAVLAGCASDPGGPFPSAAAQPACAPTDGPAIQVDLGLSGAGPSSPPYVRVSVYRRLEALGGKTWTLDPPHDVGMAFYCPGNGPCVDASRGTVRFDPGAGVRGAVDLFFPPNRRIRGTFDAPLREIHVQCG